MRGLMAKPKNQLLVVVKLLKIQFSNFKEGLSILEYFISTVLVKVLRIRP
jgi:hypothetical protein